MKTKASLIFILVFSHLFLFSQSAIGLRAGGHLASWNGDPDYKPNPEIKVGFQFGGVFEIGLSKLLAIQSEFLYIQKGVRFTFSYIDFHDGKIEVRNTISFNYLELPLLLKLKLEDLDKISFFLTVGPSFGYAINGMSKIEFTSITNKETQTNDFEFKEDDHINQFEISAAFGAGVGLPLGIGRLIFEPRYIVGLTNFHSNGNDSSDRINNTGLGISVGYMVPLSRNKKNTK